jgi:histidyl-tRNA synthetase
MAPKHQAPRGTRDLLPDEIERWQWVEERAREVLARYCYREIRTPIFEDYELFARTSGESSDVVQKEMYRFQDLKGRDLALRPEGTASVARSYLEHAMSGKSKVVRLWYMGPMFRYGRPQKGRYRQFYQIGAEIIGTAHPSADIEMIALFVDLFEAWGFRDLTVAVNSLGTPESRRAYGEALRRWLEPVREKLGPDSRQRLESNPLRVLDTKDPDEIAMFSGGQGGLGPMPRMLEVLDEESRAHWNAVLAGLDALGIRWEIDQGLVRGLDYYTRTTFEVHDRSLGAAQSALGGGGRYDGLIGSLGGPETPGVGFSIGLDRVVLVLEQRGSLEPASTCEVYVAAMEATRLDALALARELRRSFRVDCDLEARGFGAQMKAAGKSGARAMVLLGEDEWKRGEVVVKDLASSHQETVARSGLIEALREMLANQTKETRTT